MRIVLMRHGKPEIAPPGWLTPAQFGQWIAEYDAAGLAPASPPPDATWLARTSRFAVCGDLPRAMESAAALAIEAPADPEFREVGMPWAAWRFPPAPHALWLVAFRLLWRLGYEGHAESFPQANARARRGARRLSAWAHQHDSVLLVGHGSMNWLLARHLTRIIR